MLALLSPEAQESGPKVEPIIQTNHTSEIQSLAFSPDGRYFATSGGFDDATVKLWRCSDGSLLRNLATRQSTLKEKVLFTSDSRTLIVVSWYTVQLWRVADGSLLSSIPNPGFEGDAGVWRGDAISLSPDDRFLILGNALGGDAQKHHEWDASAQVFRLSDGKLLFESTNESSPLLSPDGKQLVTRYKRETPNYGPDETALILRQMDNLGAVKKIPGEYDNLAFSPDSRFLAAKHKKTGYKTDLVIFSTSDWSMTRELPVRDYDTAFFSPRGDFLAIGQKRIEMHVMRFPGMTDEQLIEYGYSSGEDEEFWDVPVGDCLIGQVQKKGSSETRLDFFRFGSKAAERSVTVQTPVAYYYLSPDRERCIVSPGRTSLKAPFVEFSLKSGRSTYAEVASHTLPLSSIEFSPDGQRFAIADISRGFSIYKTGSGAPDRFFEHAECRVVAFSKDNSLVASAAFDAKRTVKVFRVKDGSLVATLTGLGLPAGSLEFSADGKQILAAGDSAIAWDIASGGIIFSKERQGYDIWYGAHFSADNKVVIAIGGEMHGEYGSMAAWDRESGEELFSREKVEDMTYRDLVILKDGKTFAVTGAPPDGRPDEGLGMIGFYSIKDGKLIGSRKEPGVDIGALVFSPDGSTIATTSDDKVILRTAATLAPYKTLSGHTDYVSGIAFSPDGKYLVSASADASIRMWNLAAGTVASLIAFDTGDWFVFDASGRFDCSDGGRKYVCFVCGEEVYDCDQFWKDFYTPGLLTRFRAGEKFASLKIETAAKKAPTVRIVQPSGYQETRSPDLKVTVRAEPGSNGVGKILLLHNGKVLDEKTRGLEVEQDGNVKTFTISLVEGENRLIGAALDSSGGSEGRSDPLIVSFKTSQVTRPDLYILACGVSDYKDRGIRLGSPRDDAKAVTEAFRATAANFYGSVNATTLLDKDSSAKNVLRAFGDIAAKARATDTVILYFAGHGMCLKGVYYYFTYEADLADIEGSTLSIDDIRDFITNVPANKRVLFLDTCYSGGAAKALAAGIMTRSIDERYLIASAAKENGMAVFSAASETQAALESEQLGHGLFTYCLLEALSAKKSEIARAGVVSIGGLLDYVNRAVRDYASQYLNTEQNPVMFNFGDNFSLGLAK